MQRIDEPMLAALRALLGPPGLRLHRVPPDADIPGSYWGGAEAGLIGDTLFWRADTPLHSALHEAAQQGISGKASTPFLLARVNELTGGDSLAANIALVLNNARLAAAIALAYAAGANCASTVPGAKLSPL